MCLFQEMKEGALSSKVRLFHETHMRKTPEGSQDYIDQRARLVGVSAEKTYLHYYKKLNRLWLVLGKRLRF